MQHSCYLLLLVNRIPLDVLYILQIYKTIKVTQISRGLYGLLFLTHSRALLAWWRVARFFKMITSRMADFCRILGKARDKSGRSDLWLFCYAYRAFSSRRPPIIGARNTCTKNVAVKDKLQWISLWCRVSTKTWNTEFKKYTSGWLSLVYENEIKFCIMFLEWRFGAVIILQGRVDILCSKMLVFEDSPSSFE